MDRIRNRRPPPQGVGGEVCAPAQVGAVRQCHARARRALATAAPAHRQSLLVVKLENLFLLHAHDPAGAGCRGAGARRGCRSTARFRSCSRTCASPRPSARRMVLRSTWASPQAGLYENRATPSGEARPNGALRARSVFHKRSFIVETSSIDAASSYFSPCSGRPTHSPSAHPRRSCRCTSPSTNTKVCCLIPCRRQTSAVGVPAACSRSTPVICARLNLIFFTSASLDY